MTAKKERDLPISENRNVSSRLCRKPAFDGNGKTFSFSYAFIGDWLSAYMPTTKRRSWKEKFQAGGKVKPTSFARPDKNKNLRLLTVCLHTISKRRYLYRLCHKSDGCLSGFIQVTLIGLPTMALPKMRAKRNFSLGVFCEMREYKYLCDTERVIWNYAKCRIPKHSVYC